MTRPRSKQPMDGNLTMRQSLAVRLQRKFASEVSWKFGHASFETGAGKVFCFITSDGNLAMKLPAERLQSLLGSGEAESLRMGKRTMREWVVVPEPESASSLKLLREARDYVELLPPETRKRKSRRKAGT